MTPMREEDGVRRGPARAYQSLRVQTIWMGIGTALSRLTGLLRILALAYALGFTRLADAYNLANNAPNMLYDVVLGGVLSATFIPIFVERLATRSERQAWKAISAVTTTAVLLLVVATVASWVMAPYIIDAFTILGHASGARGQAHLEQEKEVATTLLRWFVPQIALYGLIGLTTALLNVRNRFIAPMWTAIANNAVCILVLLWFRYVAGPQPSLESVSLHQSQLILLGLGTTCGVALQAALLLPSLKRAHVSLRWRFEPGHEAVRAIARLGSWTLGFILMSQFVQFVVLALAVAAGGPAPVSSYTYAYAFLQMPFAIVAVSIMSAVTPDLAKHWAVQQMQLFRRRLATGLRAVIAIIVPASVGLLLLAHPASRLFFSRGAASGSSGEQAITITGSTLAMFALGLPSYCVFQYEIRVLEAMQRARTAFWFSMVPNGFNLVLALILVHLIGVPGLALALSIAYSIGAIWGLAVLRGWLGPLGSRRLWMPLRSMGVSTVAMAAVVVVIMAGIGGSHGIMLLLRVVSAVVGGSVTYLAVVNLVGSRLARRATSHR